MPHPKGREISGCRFAILLRDGSVAQPCGRRGHVTPLPELDTALHLCPEHAAEILAAGPAVGLRTWNGRRWVGRPAG